MNAAAGGAQKLTCEGGTYAGGGRAGTAGLNPNAARAFPMVNASRSLYAPRTDRIPWTGGLSMAAKRLLTNWARSWCSYHRAACPSVGTM